MQPLPVQIRLPVRGGLNCRRGDAHKVIHTARHYALRRRLVIHRAEHKLEAAFLRDITFVALRSCDLPLNRPDRKRECSQLPHIGHFANTAVGLTLQIVNEGVTVGTKHVLT